LADKILAETWQQCFAWNQISFAKRMKKLSVTATNGQSTSRGRPFSLEYELLPANYFQMPELHKY
jgi:hypothetical protein